MLCQPILSGKYRSAAGYDTARLLDLDLLTDAKSLTPQTLHSLFNHNIDTTPSANTMPSTVVSDHKSNISSPVRASAVEYKKDGTVSRMRSHRGNVPQLPQTKLCPFCPAKFTRTTHLNRHLRNRELPTPLAPRSSLLSPFVRSTNQILTSAFIVVRCGLCELTSILYI